MAEKFVGHREVAFWDPSGPLGPRDAAAAVAAKYGTPISVEEVGEGIFRVVAEAVVDFGKKEYTEVFVRPAISQERFWREVTAWAADYRAWREERGVPAGRVGLKFQWADAIRVWGSMTHRGGSSYGFIWAVSYEETSRPEELVEACRRRFGRQVGLEEVWEGPEPGPESWGSFVI